MTGDRPPVTSGSGDTHGMTPWEDEVAYLRETFINGLVGRGFRLVHDDSEAAISNATLTGERVTVTLGVGFPYLPPAVTTRAEVPRTWHQESNGNLCLYTRRDRDNRPWLDPDAFLARIDLWFAKNQQGWPDDPPVLDIEAYLDMPVDARLVIYSGLDQSTGQYLRLRGDDVALHILGPGKVPKNSNKGLLSGYVTSIGNLTTPPVTWNDLIGLVSDRRHVEDAIARGRIHVLLLHYQRGVQKGVLAVTLHAQKNAKPRPHKALSASADRSTMDLRAGPHSAGIADKHVYVVGAGALGSHICDGLSRASIGKLTIRDCDILTPSNMTRHLVANTQRCGAPKAQAVTDELAIRPYNRTELIADNTALVSPYEAADLFTSCDLVVDATADGAVTAMLEGAARATRHRLLTACVQNEGRTQRVDIVPPYNDAAPLPVTTNRPPTSAEAFEAGCGEPVSATPPYAVAEAAAMVVRHIVGTLIGQPPTSAGEVRERP